MTKLKEDLLSSTATAILPPLAGWIDGDAGGVGKSTFAVLLAQAFRLTGVPFGVFELDDQGKLARFLGNDDVTSLHGSTLQRDGGDERDLVPVFSPLHEAMIAMPESGRSLIFEIGGSLTGLVNDFVAEIDLDEDVMAFNLTLVIFLVVVASEESVRQVLLQLKTLRRLLPNAKLVLVLNERDGSPLAAASELPADLAKGLAKAAASLPTVRIPKLRDKSRRLYEKLGLPPAEIVMWHQNHYAEAIRRTGRPLLPAKTFVKDVAEWTAVVQSELARILPFLGGEAHD